MTAEEILSIHTDIFNRALKERDYDALEGLNASDYMPVRLDGSVLNKQEVLQDLRSGGLRFHSIERCRGFGCSLSFRLGELKSSSERRLT
jgi:hypothetical protein